ncbi:DCTPP1 [Plasmopara halstedii]|uniref:dCTP pyrophosphatase 1 n=1 Tax=Plasmopara halstedii TaxID=4781 RepID=A0A0P1B5C7_PLAHL|nr:DCTPP1 [Plasmopara halstedii]CEG48856.1 DCTPP1 [Plasmopara halstedii]|eukprot:XP_024585225.1 DCTPP1 [Plasmopara halstedii]
MESIEEAKPMMDTTVEPITTSTSILDVTPPPDRPLFDEYYEDWASFDAAIARATAAYHPIRKRSSLTFEVYNRTVSKGKHDRKNIAEFLSKTFKCTHGIKFRSRGSGKRLRHKLRDIGCPFHVYASAVEYGPHSYRVKVRMHDKHNHPIGPESMKLMNGALHESDYELTTHGGNGTASIGQNNDSNTTDTHLHHMEHVLSSENVLEAAYEQHIRERLANTDAQDQAQPQTNTESQAYQYAQTQAIFKVQAEVQAMSDAQAQARAQAILQSQQNHSQTQLESVDTTDILSASSHGSELLDGEIDSTMSDDVFTCSSTAQTTTNVAIPVDKCNDSQYPAKFEETMTFESLRKRIADFADERDWNEFHTPRNLLLALNGEVGELCEIFQWKGEVKNTADWSAREKEHLGEEISDVLIYLVRLADKCDVNLPAAIDDKIRKNARKYPTDLVRGSSKKYSEYKRLRTSEETTLL